MNDYEERYKKLKAENNRLTAELERQYESYNNILQRLRHLLESDFIRSFDEWNIQKGEYTRDIADADAAVLYLCDLNRKCKKSGLCCDPRDGCFRTYDIANARNFKKDVNGNYWEVGGVCPFGDNKETCADYRINKCDLCKLRQNEPK